MKTINIFGQNIIKKIPMLTVATFLISGFFIANIALAAATVNPVINGTNISIDTTSVSGGSAIFKSLTNYRPTINDNGDIAIGTHTINLPVGWEFNQNSNITIVAFNDIDLESTSITPGQTSFSFTVIHKSTYEGSIAFNGLEVRPIGKVAPTTGNITYTGADIAGVAEGEGGTNFGTLSTVAGTVAKLAFETQPSESTVYGSNFVQQPVVKTQDQFGNDSVSGLGANLDVILTRTFGTGDLVGDATLDIGAGNGTVTFTDLTIDMVGEKQLTASVTGLASDTSDSFNISTKSINVTAQTDSEEYDGTNSSDETPLVDELAFSDTVETAPIQTFEDENVGGSKVITASGLLILGGNSNYKIHYVDATGSITAKNLTVSGVITNSKEYDGGKTAIVNFDGASPLGVVESDIVALNFESSSASFDDKDVDTDKTVTVSGLTLDGLDADNYSLTQPFLTDGIITTKSLTVTAVGGDKIYDGTTSATVTLSSSDKVESDDLSYGYTGASFVDENAGEGKTINVADISLGGSDSNNYSLQSNTAVTIADIDEKSITLTINVNDKTYDGTTGAVYASGDPRVLVGVIGGDIVIAEDTGSKAFVDKDAGTDKIVNATGITLSGADKDNYSFDGVGTGVATISIRPITVTAVTQTKTYDRTTDSDNIVVITNTGGLTTGPIVGSDTTSFIKTFGSENAGTLTLTPSGTVTDGNSGNNYDLTFVNTTGGIIQKAITIEATISNKVYDGTTTATITGLTSDGIISGDEVTFSGGTAVFVDAEVGDDKVVNITGITGSGSDIENYSFSDSLIATGNILSIPSVVYVDDSWDGTTAWDDPDDAESASAFGYDAFSTIQDGIDAVEVDGTVNVAAGTYTESLTVEKSLTIIGVGDTTIINPATDANGIDITADSVTIQNLKITTTSSGDSSNLAINLQGTNGVTISGTTIETTGNTAMGIWAGVTASTNLSILGNTITINDEATGIYGAKVSPAHSGWTIGGEGNGNTVTVALGNPIELYDVTASKVSYNIITTSASGGSNVIWSSELSDLSNLVFNYNTVDYSGGSQVAFLADFQGAGFAPETTVSIVTVTGNTFDNWGGRGLRIGDRVTSVTATGNSFLHTGEALKNEDASSVNAESNYWGTAVLATIGGKTNGTIDYDPYYVNEVGGILNTVAVSTVYVDDNYSDGSVNDNHYFGYNAFAKIQEGIDAVDTDGAVNVLAGIYTEQITIGKSLNLIGAGESTTTIKAPASGRSIITDAEATFDFDYVVAADGNGTPINVKIEGFTIDGNGQDATDTATQNFVGVFFRDVGDGTNDGLYSSTIQNLGSYYNSYPRGSSGIWVLGNSILTINDNDIKGYIISGIVVNGDDGEKTDPNVVVTNNLVTGQGVPPAVSHGIQIGYGSVGTISGNTITKVPSTGIYLYKAGTGVIIDDSISANLILDSNIGLFLAYTDGATISGNLFTDNTYRSIVIQQDSDNNVVKGNTITMTGGDVSAGIVIGSDSGDNIIGGDTADDGNSFNLPTTSSIDNVPYVIWINSADTDDVTIKNNTITGGARAIQFDGPPGHSGLNTISNNLISNPSFGGIVSSCKGDFVVTGNTITNGVRPIEFNQSGVGKLTITGNTIDGITFEGVNIGSAEILTSFTGNIFKNIDGKTALAYRLSADASAKNNWWGTYTGVESKIVHKVDDASYGSVDYRPWCTDNACTVTDVVVPTITISSTESPLTNASLIPIAITFDEDVTDLTADEIIVTNGDKGTLSGSGSDYSIDVTPSGDGAVTVNIAAEVAWDLAGNYNTIATEFSITSDTTVPTLSTVSIVSDNDTGTLAKVGDKITLSFISNENIQTPTVTITTNVADITDAGDADAKTWTATYTMTAEDDTEGTIAFTIDFTDTAGNSGTTVTSVSDDSSVTFDKTAPTLAEVDPVADPTNDVTPEYIFSSDEIGTTSYGGSCASTETSAGNGSNTVTFDELAEGTYSDCTIKVTDATGNESSLLNVTAFTIDITVPTITSKVPKKDAIGIDTFAGITVLFDEDIVISASNVILKKVSGDVVTINDVDISFSSDTKIATITPPTTLANNTKYNIALSGIKDTAGNDLADENWNFTTATSYTISLLDGWNLISLPVTPTNWTDISGVLASANPSEEVKSVWTYNAPEGKWYSYSAVGGDINAISSMEAGMGYWINMNGTGTLTGSGTLYEQLVPTGDAPSSQLPQVQLGAGWNMIGYYQLPDEENADIEYALSKIDGAWSGSTADIISFEKGTLEVISSVPTMKVGEGYWIFMDTADIYSFGSVTPS